ncbi:MAG: glutaredoxin [Halioglobus sp.]|jgi:glutaredoxin
MAIIRSILGNLILLINWITTPRGIKRDATTQMAIDASMSGLTLYQYKACPFCVKVRRAAKRDSLKLVTKDAKRSEAAKKELLAGGGVLKVPCLRIEDKQGGFEWMYESTEIISFLENRFAGTEHSTTSA